MINIDTIPGRLLSALQNRGHSNDQIRSMTIDTAIGEYAAWHLGDKSWGADFLDLIRCLQEDQ